jgi:hypothetical protein
MVLTNKVAEVKKAVKQKTALYVQDSYGTNSSRSICNEVK